MLINLTQIKHLFSHAIHHNCYMKVRVNEGSLIHELNSSSNNNKMLHRDVQFSQAKGNVNNYPRLLNQYIFYHFTLSLLV